MARIIAKDLLPDICICNMKEIKQGTLYGYDVVLKVPNDAENEIINSNTLGKYIENEKKHAVENYKLFPNE